MASILYSGLVSEVRGKLGGSVLSKGSRGQVIYRKPVQRRTPTANQLNYRAGFSVNASTWNLLDTAEKLDWTTIADAKPRTDKFGNPVTLSGYQYYRLITSLAFPQGMPSPLIGDPTTDQAYEFECECNTLSIESTALGFLINEIDIDCLTINDSGSTNRFIVWISNPMTSSDNIYNSTYYRIGTVDIPGGEGSSATINLHFEEVLMPTGWRSFDGYFHRIRVQAVIPTKGDISVEQFCDKISSMGPVVVFPVFSFADEGESIAYEGSSGIFDYYWATSEKAAILAAFSFETQFAPPQVGTAPPDEGDWIDSSFTGASSAGPSSIIIPTIPGGFSGWYDVWFVDTDGTWTPSSGKVAPVRARLIHIATGQEGPWVLGFWPIIPV